MTNHAPTFVSSAATGSFGENANTTNSSALHLLSGTMSFKDSDRSDTHTTAAALRSVVWSGGSTIPTASRTDLNAAMTSAILTDSNGSGTLKWSFGAADRDFDFLAKNETLVLTYDIAVNDNHGGTVKQTVKVTITGTDDKPVVSLAAVASVTEQANQTLSLSSDTTHVALNFVDADLNNTGHTATVIDVDASGSTAGILPGSLGTAELMAFFHIDSVTKAAGSSNGTINTTFSAPDLAFDYLAAGERVDITYAIQLDDHAGGISTQNVIVTVIGTNDKPIYISGPDTVHLTEGSNVSPAGKLTAQGDFFFTDIDLSDTHTVSTTVTASRSGGGTIPLSNAALLAALSTTLDDSDGHLIGEVDWNFALSNNAVSFLSAGEVLTLTYNITVNDPAGGSATQTATVTILGTNHPVVITSGPESATVAELADTTGSAIVDTTTTVPAGTLNFSDPDTGDTHTVTTSLTSKTWSGGSAIPAATQTDLATALSTTLHDSTGTGSGSVTWNFAIPDHDLDFLGAGETLTVNYGVQVSDASTHASQTVSVTIAGANDAVVVTSGPESASLTEQANTTGSSALDTASTGTLSFNDVDLTDTHLVDVSLASAIWSFNPDFVPSTTQADLATALATTLHDSAGSGLGSVDWTFSIPDSDLDFLAAGDTLTVTYNVTVGDATSSSTQVVTITINGAEDPLIVNQLTAPVADTANQDAAQLVAAGNLIVDAGDSSGDAAAGLSVTDVNGSAANVDNTIAGTYGTLLVDSAGNYQYTANAAFDALTAADHPTDVFTFTVSNGSHSQSSTLTFAISGGDDPAVITSADATGTMTEDLGPTVLVNGGFESGDLTGWSASASVQAQFLAIGGQFGNYAAQLANSGTISQAVATTPGAHYTVSFFVTGDPESTSNSLTVTWDGLALLTRTDETSGGFTQYSFDVVGDATHSTTALQFSYGDDGTGLYLDQVAVNAATGPATETADGAIHFADAETADTHSASYTPQDTGYVGTFSVGAVSEADGAGSVGWHFTVNNSDIQFLSQGESLTQVYTVLVTDNHGASGLQDVTITINGTNDAPSVVGETVVTDVGPNGTVQIPAWALSANDTDPDTADTLMPNALVSSTGGSVVPFIDAFFIDDSTLGGSFTYTVTDGIATSAPGTATVVNNATTVTTLTGTGGDDIIIATNGSEALNGAGGNDVLVGNAGSHVLTGGTGNDIFAFLQPTDGPNTIADFHNTTEHDRIAISANGFGLSPGSDLSALFESSGDNEFQGVGAVFHFDTANHTLYYSADGTTASEVALAQLQAGVTLTAHDLMLV